MRKDLPKVTANAHTTLSFSYAQITLIHVYYALYFLDFSPSLLTPDHGNLIFLSFASHAAGNGTMWTDGRCRCAHKNIVFIIIIVLRICKGTWENDHRGLPSQFCRFFPPTPLFHPERFTRRELLEPHGRSLKNDVSIVAILLYVNMMSQRDLHRALAPVSIMIITFYLFYKHL